MNHVGGISDEQGIASGPTDHTDHHQPQIHDRGGGFLSVPYTQHMTHRPEQGPAVLLSPLFALQKLPPWIQKVWKLEKTWKVFETLGGIRINLGVSNNVDSRMQSNYGARSKPNHFS